VPNKRSHRGTGYRDYQPAINAFWREHGLGVEVFDFVNDPFTNKPRSTKPLGGETVHETAVAQGARDDF